MNAPERIWLLWADSLIENRYQASATDHTEEGGYPEFIRLDLHVAAVAAARAEGMRENVIARIEHLIAWLESDADNIHLLPADQVEILRDWLDGKPREEASK